MISNQPPLPQTDDPAYERVLFERLREICDQINLISQGKIKAYQSSASIPLYEGGNDQIVWKTGRTKAGTAPNRYIDSGWQWINGSWQNMRIFTGD